VMDGLEELRRERSFSGTNNFEIKGVFDGAHILEVSFPGTTLASCPVTRLEDSRRAGPRLLGLPGAHHP